MSTSAHPHSLAPLLPAPLPPANEKDWPLQGRARLGKRAEERPAKPTSPESMSAPPTPEALHGAFAEGYELGQQAAARARRQAVGPRARFTQKTGDAVAPPQPTAAEASRHTGQPQAFPGAPAPSVDSPSTAPRTPAAASADAAAEDEAAAVERAFAKGYVAGYRAGLQASAPQPAAPSAEGGRTAPGDDQAPAPGQAPDRSGAMSGQQPGSSGGGAAGDSPPLGDTSAAPNADAAGHQASGRAHAALPAAPDDAGPPILGGPGGPEGGDGGGGGSQAGNAAGGDATFLPSKPAAPTFLAPDNRWDRRADRAQPTPLPRLPPLPAPARSRKKTVRQSLPAKACRRGSASAEARYREIVLAHSGLITRVVGELRKFLEADQAPRYDGAYRSGRLNMKRYLRSYLRVRAGGTPDPKPFDRRTRFEKRDVEVVFCLDTSDTMTEDGGMRLEAAEQALVVLVETLGELKIPYGIIQFTGESRVVKPLRDKEPRGGQLLDAISTVGGGTDDIKARRLAEQMLQGSTATKRLIFFLTDGAGQEEQFAGIRRLEAKTPQIHVLGIGIGEDCKRVLETYPHALLVPQLRDLPGRLVGAMQEAIYQ